MFLSTEFLTLCARGRTQEILWDHHFNLRADSGSTAARARIEAEPESPMGAAISPPLWGQNVGELLAVVVISSNSLIHRVKTIRLDRVSGHDDFPRSIRRDRIASGQDVLSAIFIRGRQSM